MLAAVIIPDGHVALGKLAQALIHGAKVVPIRGSFDDALHVVRELGERGGVTVVNSINPFRIEGQKTAAFEICDALGDAPDVHCIPVGNAGQHHRVLEGLRRVRRRRHRDEATAHARVAGRRFRAARARRAGRRIPRRSPPRSGSAIRRAGTARSRRATSRAARSSAVTDAQILDAYRMLAVARRRVRRARVGRVGRGAAAGGREPGLRRAR